MSHKFKIGDTVYLKCTIEHIRWGNMPMPCTIVEQISQTCPGGTQYKYTLRHGGKQCEALDVEVVGIDDPMIREALEQFFTIAKDNRLREALDEHIQFINQPEEWPQWPFLPIKRHVDGDLECCITCATLNEQLGKVVLIQINLFEIHLLKDGDLEKRERYEYPDAKSCILDGWEVD